jgi:hypothetical protein
MRLLLLFIGSLWALQLSAQTATRTEHVFIITIDGLRWQEIFKGADERILHDRSYVDDAGLLKEMYWDADTAQRRKKLLPFFWNVIARKGQLYGNRMYGNKMNVANRYKFSYPGYNEIFTGYADARFVPNTPVVNKNTNVLEFLNREQGYEGKVVAFTSWDVFPYILNEKRSGLMVNSGYEPLPGVTDTGNLCHLINTFQDGMKDKGNTRFDELTYLSAREYIQQHHPRVALIGLGEADEFAHHGKYDKYLQSAANADRMIAELWYYVQTDPFYKDKTTFIITTDHGRGRRPDNWTDHLFLVKGSKEIWMAVLGPDILPLGEIKTEQVLYQKQIAATIAWVLGKQFSCEHRVSDNIYLPVKATQEIVSNGEPAVQ